MSPLVAAVLGAVVGLLVGGLLVAELARRHRDDRPAAPERAPAGLPEIVDALRCAAVVVGPADEIVMSNAAASALGVVRGTRIGIPAVLDLVRSVRSGGEAASRELMQERGAGRSDLHLAVRVVPIPGRLVFVAADDRAPALRVQESTRDFLANSAHELKTPVGAISLLAEATESAPDDPVAVARFARKIRREASRLGMLVHQMITLSRLQGDPVRAPGRVEVDPLVDRAIDHARELAERRSVDLVTGERSGLAVVGDPDRLLTALGNLLDNAITYSEESARVVVSVRPVTRPEGPSVAIAVSDNGPGIAPEEQGRVFERFYRVDYARTRETGGTGLGLSIVNEIVEGHGGEVTVWSRPGSGSTFTMLLPAAPDPAEEGR